MTRPAREGNQPAGGQAPAPPEPTVLWKEQPWQKAIRPQTPPQIASSGGTVIRRTTGKSGLENPGMHPAEGMVPDMIRASGTPGPQRPARHGVLTSRRPVRQDINPNPCNIMSTSNLFDYEVQDCAGEKIGKVENVWTDGHEDPGFLGVSTGWLGLGQTHVVPARNAVIDHRAQTIKIPYTEDTIKSSPSYLFSDELTDAEESRLRSHYKMECGNCGTTDHVTGAPVTEFRNPVAADRRSAEETVTAERTVEVPLAEEKLHVEKRQVSQGEVRLRKVVRTEIVNQPVELRHEEVVVERVSDTGREPGAEPFVEKVISIPLTEEEAVIRKTVESAGAVKATKLAESEERTISETLRKEDVEVERETTGARR